MKLLLAMVRYELKLQWRSARFRIGALGYVAVCAAPSCLLYFQWRHHADEVLGSASYLAQTLDLQPYLTVIMVVLVAGNRSSAEALRESWSVLAASPMSNLGFVLRRWFALLVITVPLAAIPFLVALTAALAAGHESFDPATWLGSWGLRILPLTVVVTAYWLAWVTVTGGEVAALITTFVGWPIVVSAANQILLRYRLTLAEYLEWFGYRDAFYWIAYTSQRWTGGNSYHPGYAATEAPYDVASAAAWLLPRGALAGALAALGLGLAAAFVRRTRRDLPPRPVPEDHPLRTFLRKLNRQRELYAPDGGLGLRERLALAAGVVAFGLALSLWIGRQLHFHTLAAERYQAETESDFDPVPMEVKPVSWRVRGRVDRTGRVDVRAESRFHNDGTVPVETLAFSLHQELEIARLEASRGVEAVRAWDRLRLRLDPPLAGGESLDLELHLAGTPANVDFRYGTRYLSFAVNHERTLNARFPRDVADLSRTWVRRAASPRRIALRAMDLGPVPRYSPWTLTVPNDSDEDEGSLFGREVPPETARAMVDLELDLETPPDWFLADTCGHASRTEAGRTRLRGTCRTSLTELMAAGGRLVAVESDDPGSGGQVTFAALPSHRELVERQLGSLARTASLSDRAWPGMPGLNGLVAVEWPTEFHVQLRHQMRRWDDWKPELIGRLLLIPERRLIDAEPLKPEDLVAQLLSRDLLERRQLAGDEEVLFRNFFRSLMIRRMGLDGDRGATVSGKPWVRQMLQTPILGATPRQGVVWRLRLPAVLAEMESRVGADTFYAAIESFLAAGGGEPGTVEELFAELESRSGVSLERTYEDHFRGDALPILELMDVRSRRLDEGWEVEGKVHNRGSGQAVCPVIVKTEVSEVQLTVTVDSKSSSPFTTHATSRPHTVLLDPNRTCYRWLLNTSNVLERANLLE